MLGRKTGACKEILFSPHRSYVFFNLFRYFGLQFSRKHLIFLLVVPPPDSPESSMRGAGALTCSWHWLHWGSLCTLHTHTLPFPPKIFISQLPSPRQHFIAVPACAAPPAAAACRELCCTRNWDYTQGWPLKQRAWRSLSPSGMNYWNYTNIVGFPPILWIFAGLIWDMQLQQQHNFWNWELKLNSGNKCKAKSPVPFSMHCC